MILQIIRIAILNLREHWRVLLVMVLFFAINVFAYLVLIAYQTSIDDQYNTISQEILIVHEADTAAEYYGSRINPEIGEQLKALGYEPVIPAIHSFTATAGREVRYIYGVDLSLYQKVESFQLLEGRALQPGDSDRLAMVGYLLAGQLGVKAGETISLRGRDFEISGIFKTGTFTDNDAWISLTAAQNLLGWGNNVSYYLIPNQGVLKPGDVISPGVIVSRRGEGVYASSSQSQTLLKFFALIIQLIGICTILTLGSLILRITFLHQYPLALLRVSGFPKYTLSIYVFVHAGVIFSLGFLIGLFASIIFPLVFKLEISGWVILPVFQFQDILLAFLFLFGLVCAGAFLPILWLNKVNLGNLLRSG